MDQYMITENNEIKYGPGSWSAPTYTKQISKLGCNSSLPAVGPELDIEFGNGVTIKNIGTKPAFDRNTQNCTSDTEGFTVSEKPQEEIDAALAVAKTKAITRANNEAERARMAFVTPGSGQAREYSEVAKEIARLQRNGAEPISEGDYPFLEAGIGYKAARTGVLKADIYAAADAADASTAKWTVEGPKIRRERLAKIAAINAATAFEGLALI